MTQSALVWNKRLKAEAFRTVSGRVRGDLFSAWRPAVGTIDSGRRRAALLGPLEKLGAFMRLVG